jgi:cytochrome c oxidase cbb3-type subunit II
MKNIYLIFCGALFCLLFSFSGIVVSNYFQCGALEPVALEDGAPKYPGHPLGMAEQGKAIYINQGCAYCHSQQTRPKGFGADIERGWANRQSVARDYIYQNRVLLGTMRTGPDLVDVGTRLSTADWHHLHLYDPRLTSPGSNMPPFEYLYKKQKIKGEPSPKALRFPPDYPNRPETGFEIVPTERAEQLVSYLLHLKLDYELPESKFVD